MCLFKRTSHGDNGWRQSSRFRAERNIISLINSDTNLYIVHYCYYPVAQSKTMHVCVCALCVPIFQHHPGIEEGIRGKTRPKLAISHVLCQWQIACANANDSSLHTFDFSGIVWLVAMPQDKSSAILGLSYTMSLEIRIHEPGFSENIQIADLGKMRFEQVPAIDSICRVGFRRNISLWRRWFFFRGCRRRAQILVLTAVTKQTKKWH